MIMMLEATPGASTVAGPGLRRALRGVLPLVALASLASACEKVELDGIDPLIGDVEADHLGVRLAKGSFHRLATSNHVATALDENDELVVVDPWDRSLCGAGRAPDYALTARAFADGPRNAGMFYSPSLGWGELDAEPPSPVLVVYQAQSDDDGYGTIHVIDQDCSEHAAALSDARLVWPQYRGVPGGYWAVDRSQRLFHLGPGNAEFRPLGQGVTEFASAAHFWLIESGELRVLDLDDAELGRLGAGAANLIVEAGKDSSDAAWFEDDAGVHRVTASSAGEIVDELLEPGACALQRSPTGMASMVSPCAGGELVAYNATGFSADDAGVSGAIAASLIPLGHRLTLGPHPASPVEVYATAGSALFFFEAIESVGSERVGTLWGSVLEHEAIPIAERVLIGRFVVSHDGSSGYGFLSDWDGERGTLRAWSPTGGTTVLAEDVHELSWLGDVAITGYDGQRGTLVRPALNAPPEVLLEDVVSEHFAYQTADTSGYLVISDFDGLEGTLSSVPYREQGPPVEIARRVRPSSSPHGWTSPEYAGITVGVRHDVNVSTGLGVLTLRSGTGEAELSDVSEWIPVYGLNGVAALAARESGLWLVWLP